MHEILQDSKAVEVDWCCLLIVAFIFNHQTSNTHTELYAKKHTSGCSSVRFKSNRTALELRLCSSYLSSVTEQQRLTRENN